MSLTSARSRRHHPGRGRGRALASRPGAGPGIASTAVGDAAASSVSPAGHVDRDLPARARPRPQGHGHHAPDPPTSTPTTRTSGRPDDQGSCRVPSPCESGRDCRTIRKCARQSGITTSCPATRTSPKSSAAAPQRPLRRDPRRTCSRPTRATHARVSRRRGVTVIGHVRAARRNEACPPGAGGRWSCVSPYARARRNGSPERSARDIGRRAPSLTTRAIRDKMPRDGPSRRGGRCGTPCTGCAGRVDDRRIPGGGELGPAGRDASGSRRFGRASATTSCSTGSTCRSLPARCSS